jgi:MarR family transcriptional regulator for hemolysin
MPGAPSRQELFDDLSAFNRKLRAAFDALVREHGMTLSRARVFRKLSRRDGINQRELADELEL